MRNLSEKLDALWCALFGYRCKRNATVIPPSKRIVNHPPVDEFMYDWIITYNPYEQSWKAYHREDHMRFWNGMRTQYITFEATAADELVAMIFQHHRP